MTFTEEQVELLKAVSDYYEFPFAVFFLTAENFKKRSVFGKTRREDVDHILNAYSEIEQIILSTKEVQE